MSGHHVARVADHIRRILADAVRRELHDPRLGWVSVNHVRLSPDLHQAVAYVSLMGDEPDPGALAALNHAAPLLRRLLARRAGLRHTPELRFVVDESIERGRRLERIFEEVRPREPEPRDEP